MNNTQYILAHHLRHLTDTELAVCLLFVSCPTNNPLDKVYRNSINALLSRDINRELNLRWPEGIGQAAPFIMHRIRNNEVNKQRTLSLLNIKDPEEEDKVVWRDMLSHLTDNELLSLDIYPEQQDLLDAEVNKRFANLSFGTVLRRCLMYGHCKSLPKWRELLIKKYRENKRSKPEK